MFCRYVIQNAILSLSLSSVCVVTKGLYICVTYCINMETFDDLLAFRLDTELRRMLDELVRDREKYESYSHVIRCAIIKLHREEIQNAKRKSLRRCEEKEDTIST